MIAKKKVLDFKKKITFAMYLKPQICFLSLTLKKILLMVISTSLKRKTARKCSIIWHLLITDS